MPHGLWSWIPNSLTVLRFFLGLALPWSPTEWQFGMLLAAGGSDLVDGPLSRFTGVTSKFGQLFDPIADKTLVLSAVGTAWIAGWLKWPELLGLAARDITVLLLSVYAVTLGWQNVQRLTPRISGKVATGGQVTALLAVFWRQQPLPWLVWTAAVLSILAAIDYAATAVIAIRQLRKFDRTSGDV